MSESLGTLPNNPTETTVSAHMILHNGKVLTVDKDFAIAEAIAIRDGKFFAVGSNNEVKMHASPETELIDLAGRTVTPGLIDAHCHPLGLGMNALASIQIGAVHTKEALLKELKEKTAKVPPGEWITTNRNWPAFHLRGEDLPTLADLDATMPDNPLSLPYGHAELCNSLAMQVAGITKATLDPEGGTIVRDPVTGEPTGRLEENATRLVTRFLPSPPPPVDCAKVAQSFYNSLGVTAVQEDNYDPIAWLTLKASDELTLRYGWSEMVDPGLSVEAIFTLIHAISGAGLPGICGLGDEMLRLRGLVFQNESLWPYPGAPMWNRDKLLQVCLEAAKCKIQVRQHCEAGMIPDNLDILVEVDNRYPIKDLRWAIGHQRWPNKEHIRIQKELGCVVNQEIAFAVLSIPTLERERRRFLPLEENRLFCPVPLWLEAGVPVCLTTDGGGACTPDALSIWACVWVATNRHLFPEFDPQFSITREDALRAITNGGAYWMGMEDKLGSIEVGKLADLAVLSADPMTCPDEELKDTKALMTIVGGRIVYQR